MEGRSPLLVLAGGTLVLADRVIEGGSLILDGARIAAIDTRPRVDPAGATLVDVRGATIVPGFIDVHVHGLIGHDTLDEGDPIARMAAALPQFGVTAFCPTSVACEPPKLRRLLERVRAARDAPVSRSARVLGAHLESNFVSPDFAGAQPVACLRTPLDPRARPGAPAFGGGDILDVIAEYRAEVRIVTLAPELRGGLDLVATLVAAGHRVALGHSGADFETAIAAIDAGARHATHLFNRMPPLLHRAPGLAGAVLSRDEIAAEIIGDGHHVHPAVGRMAVRLKGVPRTMAVTDGTALSGLPAGASGRLGGRRIRSEGRVAVLADEGTLAGSTATMDAVLRTLVHRFGCSIVDAAAMCAATPATELGLIGLGVIAEGATADLVVLDRDLCVTRTFIDGQEVYDRHRTAPRDHAAGTVAGT